jgi:glycosyltransferase involved in cell wall biosynthesis
MVFLNARRFIVEAIESVKLQSFSDWELVLVDDGSDDGSHELAAEFSASDPARVRVVQHPDRGNHGTGASRNLGLSHCRGEYVAFLDADDVYLPPRLKTHVELLDRHPDVALLQGCVQRWHSWSEDSARKQEDRDEPAPPVPLERAIDPPQLLVLMLRSQGHTVPAICSLTLRIDDVRRLGGFESSFRHAYEDQVLLAKLYMDCRTLVVEEVLARYRQHPESLVHRLEREGTYVPGWPNPAHQAFVEWLQQYVDAHSNVSNELRDALHKELQPYVNPWAWRIRHLPALSTRLARRLAQRVLPAALLAPVLDWRRRQKEDAAGQRALREGRRLGIAASRQSESEGRT